MADSCVMRLVALTPVERVASEVWSPDVALGLFPHLPQVTARSMPRRNGLRREGDACENSRRTQKDDQDLARGRTLGTAEEGGRHG